MYVLTKISQMLLGLNKSLRNSKQEVEYLNTGIDTSLGKKMLMIVFYFFDFAFSTKCSRKKDMFEFYNDF